ncbi:MAG: hypothetical protein HZA53_14715 [Planctomycetes bacterium]|nr:hypothetical protein [Planctomycetota bacterium]
MQTLFSLRRGARSGGARVFLAAGAGGVLCALLLFLPAALQLSGRSRAPVRVWAADRDAHRVVGLDGDLIVVRELQLAWPVALAPRVDGGLWVLRSGNATASFGMRLSSLAASGVEESETWIEAGEQLAVVDGRDALVVEYGTGANSVDRVLRVQPDGAARVVLEDAHLHGLCASRGTVVVGTTDGRLARYEASGSKRLLAKATWTASFGALAEGGPPGAFFALDTSAQHRLEFVGDDLARRWSVPIGFDARHLGVVAGEERVWVADVNGSRVRRYGPGGVLERDHVLPAHALDHPVAFADGVLVATPGAILRVDSAGQPRPGQGGFAWLSDLVPAR